MKHPARGFTLIELMVVITIVALGTALASLALRDSRADALERDAQRLAALLEAARAQSRAAGVPVTWRASGAGFAFDGLPPSAEPLPTHWLDAATTAEGNAPLQLGPDPVIGAQSVVLRQTGGGQGGGHNGGQGGAPLRLRVGTDGLQPFSVQALP